LAQDQTCVARVNGTDIVVAAGAGFDGTGGTTLRERLLSWPRQTWNRALGAPVSCDSETIIAFLGAVLAVDQIDRYCLSYDAETDGFLLVPGVRNYRGRCQKTVCDRVNVAADQTTGFLGAMTQAIWTQQGGLLGLTHSSGAMLLTGSSSALIETVGGAATSVLAALSTPAAMTATAVTVVAVGGGVYVCRE
jgi:hypothetical protein